MSSSSGDHEAPAPVIDGSVAARHVSLEVVCALLQVLSRMRAFDYSQVVDRPTDPVRRVTLRRNGDPLRRTSRYHHFNCMKILGLVEVAGSGYRTTELGEAVARSCSCRESAPLTGETLQLLREAALGSDYVWRNFLCLFARPSSRSTDALRYPVGIAPIPGTRTYRLCSRVWEPCLGLTIDQTEGVLWGLRQWCQDLGLIDEIYVRPQADVHAEMANILYYVNPVAPARSTVDWFEAVVRRHLDGDPVSGGSISMSIPLLLYRMCPAEQLPLDRAKQLMRVWLTNRPGFASVEGASLPVLKAGRHRRGASGEGWAKQLRAFLDTDGVCYSRLIVSATVD